MNLSDKVYDFFRQLKRDRYCNYQQSVNGCGSGSGVYIVYLEHDQHEVVTIFQYYSEDAKKEVIKIVASDDAVKKWLEEYLDLSTEWHNLFVRQT